LRVDGITGSENDVMTERGFLTDRVTQAWVRVTGQTADLGEHPWLDGPVGDPNLIADEGLPREAQRQHASAREGRGLRESFDLLRSDRFDPAALAPEIVAFYEHTTDWRLNVW
jgi:hypothetical protein